MFKRLALLLLLLCPFSLWAAPAITVSGNSVTILGSAQTISLTCTLIDPNNTGNLSSGGNIITVFVTSTATPGNVATCGPLYGNDIITDGYNNSNTTYYKVQVFTVNAAGIIASTPSLQQFYAFNGSGTVDLATATPLAPSFFTGPSGNVTVPGSLTVLGSVDLSPGIINSVLTQNSGSTQAMQVAGLPLGNGNADVTSCPYTVKADSGTTTLDRGTVIEFNSSAACSVTLPDPTATGMGAYFPFRITNIGAGTVTVNRQTSATFTVADGTTSPPPTGLTSFTVATSEFATVHSDNANWHVEKTQLAVSSNAGKFDNAAYYQYHTVAIGGCSPSALYSSINGGNETSALTVCIAVPPGATQRQSDGIASMVSSGAGAASPAVGMTGGAVLTAANGRIFGGNFLASDNGFSTTALNGVETDVSVSNAATQAHGHAIVLFGSAQPIAGSQAFQINSSSPGNFWPRGLECSYAATTTVSATTGCVFLNPVATGTSQPSQGITFVSSNASQGDTAANFSLLANGDMSLANSNTSGGLATKFLKANGGVIATGSAAGLTGTGACGTITTQHGGAWAGDAKCTGTTGASTLTITPGTTAPNGWVCNVQDETTRANLFQQTSNSPTTCVLTVTSVTQNDVFVFSAIAY